MDRKSIAILVVSLLVLMAWYPLVDRLYPRKPQVPGANTLASATNRLDGATNASAGSNQIPQFTATLPTTAGQAVEAVIKPAAPEQLLVLENDKARYTFSSYGGGIKQVELKQHPRAVGSDRGRHDSGTNLAALNLSAPLPAMSFLANAALQGDGVYALSKITNGLRAEKPLTNGLVLVREFRLSTNYLVEASLRFENRGPSPLVLPMHELVIGTATPIGPRDRNATLVGVIEFNGARTMEIGDAWFANRTLGCLPGTPRDQYVSGTNVVWGAAHNQFFALAVIPQDPASRLTVRRIPLPSPSREEVADDSKLIVNPAGFQTTFLYPETALGTNQIIERRFTLFAGPKEYNTLARIGQQMNNQLDLIMGYGGFFGFFAKLLLLSMNGLHALGLGYGFAIIAITVIIKGLFWPLTNASTRSMKRMAALQPQMKALQEKYKDDPKKMNSKLMEFMKEHKVSPVSGCFPMLLQIPVFFGFYRMLQSAIELRGQPFLWAVDLSTADTVWMIPGLNFPVNPLPLVMGVTMLWQARMTPPSPGMDPVQQRIMKYMPLMFMVFLYNFSAGLTLYWTVQNLLTIAQMKLTRNESSQPGSTPKSLPGRAPFPGKPKRKTS